MLRRLAFLLVTLLLIVRGLLGDAVAMGLAADAGPLLPVAAVSGQSAPHTLPEGGSHVGRMEHGDDGEHGEHGSSGTDVTSTAQTSPAQHCIGQADAGSCAEPQGHSASTCAACGMCHPAPQALPSGLSSPAATAAAPPAECSARFASAHRTRVIRPPITRIASA